MECPRCRTDNLDENVYCGKCGAPLKPNADARAEKEPELRDQVVAILHQELKDAKIVEVEIAEAIASRLTNWAKTLSYFLGIPLALLMTVFGFLGFKTYSDVSKLVETAQKQMAERLEIAAKQLDIARNKALDIDKEYNRLIVDIQALKHKQELVSEKLSQEVSKVDDKVRAIQKEFEIRFKDSSHLAPQLKTKLEKLINDYKRYCVGLGFTVEKGWIEIQVEPETKVGKNAFYDGEKNVIVAHPLFAEDPDAMCRAFTHAVLEDHIVWGAIQSGLADYFACSFLGDPKVGESSAKVLMADKEIDKPYLRNLDNERKFSAIRSHQVPQDAGEVWGGAFWDIRKALGPKIADRLLASTVIAMSSSKKEPSFETIFVRKLVDDAGQLDKKYADQIAAIFEKREFKQDSSVRSR